MAYEGELVKLQNGRWARFQRCPVVDAGGYQTSVLVAVELDGHYQQMLDEAHSEYLSTSQPIRMTLDADSTGKWALQVAETAAMH